MNKMLYTQKEVLKKLKKEGVVTFTKTPFLEAVKRGTIPYTHEDGVKSKMYDYDAVVKAIVSAGIGNPPKSPEDIPDPDDFESEEEYIAHLKKKIKKNPTLTDANIIKTIFAGKREQLKYEEEMGLLVSQSEVESKAFNVSRSIRDKIMSIPERLANEIATMNNPHQVKELLYKEFGVLLEGFSEDSYL